MGALHCLWVWPQCFSSTHDGFPLSLKWQVNGGSGMEDGEYKIEGALHCLWVWPQCYQAHSMEFSPKWQVNGGMKHNHALR